MATYLKDWAVDAKIVDPKYGGVNRCLKKKFFLI